MKTFIDEHRDVYGVEPICKILPIAPSTYYLHAGRQANPALRAARAQRDEVLRLQIRRIWEENFQTYRARKVLHQLQREGFSLARCTLERLMRQLGLKGIMLGKTVKTTLSNPNVVCPLDRSRQSTVQRRAPECVVGCRFHLCENPARLCLCGLCDRCLFPLYRRLEGFRLRAD